MHQLLLGDIRCYQIMRTLELLVALQVWTNQPESPTVAQDAGIAVCC